MSSAQNLHATNPYVLRNRLYLKEFFKRPVVLTIAILYGISIIMYLFNMAVVGATMMSTFVDMMNNIGTLTEGMSSGSNFSMSFSLSGDIINCVVFMIAFILMYVKAKNPDPNVAPTAGVTTFWAMSIIGLVSCIFAAVLLAFFIVIFILFAILFAAGAIPLDGSTDALMYNFTSLSSASAYSDDAALTTVLVVMFVVFAVVFAFLIAYVLFVGIAQFRFASSMRKSLTTPNLERKGAVAFAVVCIFSAVTIVFSIFGNLVYALVLWFVPLDTLFPVPVNFAMFIPVILCSTVSLIVSLIINISLAKFALGYNKHIKAAGINGKNLPMPVVVSTPASTAPENIISENVYAAAVTPAAPIVSYENPTPTSEAELISEDVSAEEVDVADDNTEATDTMTQALDSEDVIEPKVAEKAPEPDNPYADSAPLSMQSINPEAREIVDSVLTSVSQGEEKQKAEPAPAASAEQPASDAINFCCACGNPMAPDALFCSRCGNKLR